MSICTDRKNLLLLCTLAVLAACDPYPDQGEFLAGPVFAQNFIAGVKPQMGGANPFQPTLLAVRGQALFSLVITRGTSTTAVSSAGPATSPFWTDGTKRDPLLVANAQQVYAFDGPCQGTGGEGYVFNPYQEIIRKDKQYPVFQDIPEVLSSQAGKPGRSGAYSAVVQVVHLALPADFPCQSVKRFATAKARSTNDLLSMSTEYRLYQVLDPALARPPTPYQLGFFDQLLVPFIDMGPVPLTADGSHFASMPLYHLVDPMGAAKLGADGSPLPPVAVGQPGDPPVMGVPAYSPICLDAAVTVPGQDAPFDASLPIFQTAKAAKTLSSCIVCGPQNPDNVLCPFGQSYLSSGFGAL